MHMLDIYILSIITNRFKEVEIVSKLGFKRALAGKFLPKIRYFYYENYDIIYIIS